MAIVGVCMAGVATNLPAAEVESLAKRIDRLIDAKYSGPRAPQADDAELVRRTYLDLIGRIPTVDEARAYLSDKAARQADEARRPALGDARSTRDRMTEAFQRDAHGASRRARRVDASSSATSFEKNVPWDEMVRARSSTRATTTETLRGAAFFAVNRLSKVGQQDTDYPGPDARRRPVVPRHGSAVRPMPQPPLHRRLQAGRLPRALHRVSRTRRFAPT